MDPDGMARAATAFHGAWRWMVGVQPTGVVEERDGVLVVATGLADRTLNPAYVVRPPRDPERALRWGCERRASLAAPSTGYDLPEGGYRNVEKALSRLGFVERVRRPGMVLEVGALAAPAPPAELDVHVVREHHGWAGFAAVQVDAFGMAPDIAASFPPYDGLTAPGATLLVGVVSGDVVATAFVAVTSDIAGIYAVATRPACERRGYGSALTAAAVRHAATQGASHAALQATVPGFPVYQRLGFRETGDWVVWVDPAVE